MKNTQKRTKSNPKSNLPQKRLKAGNATFLPGFTRVQMREIIKNMSESKQLKQDMWTIGKHTHQFILDMFKFMQNTEVIQLHVIMLDNFSKQIFTQMMQVRYQNLVQLRMFTIQISNIQNLAFLNAPSLKILELPDNFITQVTKVLGKAIFPNLIRLDFQQNLISEIEIGRFRTPYTMMRFYHSNRKLKFYLSIHYLAKLEMVQMLQFGDLITRIMFSQANIKQRKVMNALVSKQHHL